MLINPKLVLFLFSSVTLNDLMLFQTLCGSRIYFTIFTFGCKSLKHNFVHISTTTSSHVT